jgi:hypothetical protein
MWKFWQAADTTLSVKCNAHRGLWTAPSGQWPMSDGGRILHRAQCSLSRGSRITLSVPCAPRFACRRMSAVKCTTTPASCMPFSGARLTRPASRFLANDVCRVPPAQRLSLPLLNEGSKLAPHHPNRMCASQRSLTQVKQKPEPTRGSGFCLPERTSA